MTQLCQQKYKQTIIEKKQPIINSVRFRLIKYNLIINKPMVNILINALIHKKNKYILAIEKVETIVLKFISYIP